MHKLHAGVDEIKFGVRVGDLNLFEGFPECFLKMIHSCVPVPGLLLERSPGNKAGFFWINPVEALGKPCIDI